jgi:hypothetical protein
MDTEVPSTREGWWGFASFQWVKTYGKEISMGSKKTVGAQSPAKRILSSRE